MLRLLRSIYHYILGFSGHFIYGFPARKLFVLGVTGTKGKSTVLELINAILETAGKKTALLSSVRIKIGSNSQKNYTSNTMPGRFFIAKFLNAAVKEKCDYALIEVTSQGIRQHRHRFVDFDAALLTNLQKEHIEAHGSFENYRSSKVKFFYDVARHSKKAKKIFVLNAEDKNVNYFRDAVDNFGEIAYFSRQDFIEDELQESVESIVDWLKSDFNLENAAAATAFAYTQKIDRLLIGDVLKKFPGVPGRLETIQPQPFKVVVDYAHTPDSLESVYRFLSSRNDGAKRSSESKLICVLGSAGGGRDKWKRPVMGKIAEKYCKSIVLTNEDPYDEKPAQILAEIKSGILDSESPVQDIYEILDRKEAIQKALSLAKKGDVVVITGKGSESFIHFKNGKKVQWNEKEVVKEALKIL